MIRVRRIGANEDVVALAVGQLSIEARAPKPIEFQITVLGSAPLYRHRLSVSSFRRGARGLPEARVKSSSPAGKTNGGRYGIEKTKDCVGGFPDLESA